MRIRHRVAAALGLLSIMRPAATAAGQTPAESDARAIDAREMLRSPTAFSPNLQSVVRSQATVFTLGGSNDEGIVSVQTGLMLGSRNLTAGLEAAANEGGPNTTLAELTGLSSGTTGLIGLTGVHWFSGREPQGSPGRAATVWCERAKARGLVPTNYDCGSVAGSTLPPDARAEFKKFSTFAGRPVTWALEVKGGPRDFAFVSTTAVANERTLWQTAYRAGLGIFRLGGFASLGVAYKTKYKEGDDADICEPITGSTVLKCTSTKFGPPVKKQGMALAIDFRRLLANGVGVAPRFGYDATKSSYAAQLPIYFIPNEKNSLIGGILPSWESNGAKGSLGIFIGSAFNLSITKP
jgi:hypothetical protein